MLRVRKRVKRYFLWFNSPCQDKFPSWPIWGCPYMDRVSHQPKFLDVCKLETSRFLLLHHSRTTFLAKPLEDTAISSCFAASPTAVVQGHDFQRGALSRPEVEPPGFPCPGHSNTGTGRHGGRDRPWLREATDHGNVGGQVIDTV